QPMSHGAGFFMPAWFMSGGVCVAMERYEPAALLDLAERHAVETIKVVPTMLLQLFSAGVELPRSLPKLRQVIYGASPMPVHPLGRTDDVIISGGFNIAPRAIEDVLARHPAVLECAVVGLPHGTLGQEVAAFVSLRPGTSATEEEIIDYTRGELGFQKPRRV